jgi:hypothetical protein
MRTSALSLAADAHYDLALGLRGYRAQDVRATRRAPGCRLRIGLR